MHKSLLDFHGCPHGGIPLAIVQLHMQGTIVNISMLCYNHDFGRWITEERWTMEAWILVSIRKSVIATMKMCLCKMCV